MAAITQAKWRIGDAEHGIRHDGAKERCIYPNLKLSIYTAGIRQNQLAKQLGIDEGYLSRILNGVRVPGEQIQVQIANALGCDAEWLFKHTTVKAVGRKFMEDAKIG